MRARDHTYSGDSDPVGDLIAARDDLAGRFEALRLILDARPAWHQTAACRSSDLDFTSKSPNVVARCLQLCGVCQHREVCRDWADEVGDTNAVLGGEDRTARMARWRVRGRVTARSTEVTT